jgi:uncharacterized protein
MKIFAALVAFFVFLTPAWAAPTFPALTGRVVDDGHILSDPTKADLDQKLAGLEQKTSRQLVVVTVPSLQGYEISDYGYQLGRAWGIGQAKLNNGILLIVAPAEHKVRIEVGYGLEPIVTDALSSVIIQTQILPKFRAGDFNAGVEAGVDALIRQLSLETSEAEKRAAAAADQLRGHRNNNGGDMPGWLTLLIFFGIFGFIAFNAWAHPGGRRGFYGGGPYWGGGGGGWYGGGGGWSGGGGGGGFGGGGGSFGGGGSSGSW